jgi:hypothetical protein
MSRLEDAHAARLRREAANREASGIKRARLDATAAEETRRKLRAELSRLISLLELLGAPDAEKCEFTDFSTWRRGGVLRSKRPATRITKYGWKLYEHTYTIRPEVEGYDIYYLWVDGGGTIGHGVAPRSISSLKYHEAKGILAGVTRLIAKYEPQRPK